MFFSDYQVENYVYLRYHLDPTDQHQGVEGRFTYLKTKTGIKVNAKINKKISKNRHPIRILFGGGFLLDYRLFFEGRGYGVPDFSMKLPFLI